jgi:hypothetical protein
MRVVKPVRQFLSRVAFGAALAGAACILFAPEVRSQRTAQPITQTAVAHSDALVSPNGQFAIARVPTGFRIVNTNGTNERQLVSLSSPGDVVWSPVSTGIYFVDGFDVRFRSATSVAFNLVHSFQDALLVRLFDVGFTGTLYGARLDSTSPPNNLTYVWKLPTTGMVAPVEVASTFLAIDGVQVDPAEQYIAYAETAPIPFSPVLLTRIDIDGANPVPLGSGSIGFSGGQPQWIDLGDTVLFNAVDSNVAPRQEVYTASVSGVVEPRTDLTRFHRDAVVSEDQTTVVLLPENDGFGGNGPAIMPAAGGSVVYLDAPGALYQYSGKPSISGNGQRVVFAARSSLVSELPRIYTVTAQRDPRVFPRAAWGSAVTFELPLQAGEVGALFLALTPAASPITFPGIAGQLALPIDGLFEILSGAGATASLQLTLPAVTGFEGVTLWLQGVRLGGPGGAEWTRHGSLTIF